jgi:hypothetical protein
VSAEGRGRSPGCERAGKPSGSPTSPTLDRRGMALRIGCHRPVLTPGSRLVDERRHDRPAGCGRLSDCLASGQAGRPDRSFQYASE